MQRSNWPYSIAPSAHPSGGELHFPLAASSSRTASKSDVSPLPDWERKTASLASLASFAWVSRQLAVTLPSNASVIAASGGVMTASLASRPCPLFLDEFLPDGDACDACDAVLPCCSGEVRASMWIVRVWPLRSNVT